VPSLGRPAPPPFDDVVISPEWLVGPAAALAGALMVIRVLWAAHTAADARDRADRDEWKARWEAADRRLAAVNEILRKAAPK